MSTVQPARLSASRLRVALAATACLLAPGVLAGCRSFKARYVDPHELRHGMEVGGVPISVHRDQWLKLTHKRVRLEAYAVETVPVPRPEPGMGDPSGVGGIPVTPNETAGARRARVVRDVSDLLPKEARRQDKWEQEIVSVNDVYALDVVRPFSGSSEHGVTLKDDKGHLHSVTAKTDDKTLGEVLSKLGDIKEFIGFSADKAREVAALRAGVDEADVRVVEIPESIEGIYYFDIRDLQRGIHRPVLVLPFDRSHLCVPPCVPPGGAVGPCPDGAR